MPYKEPGPYAGKCEQYMDATAYLAFTFGVLALLDLSHLTVTARADERTAKYVGLFGLFLGGAFMIKLTAKALAL